MRLFTAVTLGSAMEARATAAIERLRPVSPKARWVKPEGVHLTLVFLGEVDAAQLPALGEALTPVSHHHAPFTLTIEGGGCFGVPRHPHVLWAGVGGDIAALGALQAEVATVLEPLGFAKEKRMYTAHLTLARSKEPRGDATFLECQQVLAGEHWGQARVEHLVLFESRGGRYEPRLELPLAGAP
ncbi:RNA 2',3'-cyclic phosphodiesterase [Hyalangium rubrum]|uniref:RNA 2',3'-cyclic phosphodiesterase n=1 Tax=Hyalangium rubrum TaxID=3103134 RepID=A0ABU5H2K0_9BACT|nr:RNA 2',3'-cyclic phosphodiesterase [Hyalangium sp. s54d21]MDY7227659.1 RNA 2',3'-cyclic phosphodiesterase [Hyalangium sp. s54d21]